MIKLKNAASALAAGALLAGCQFAPKPETNTQLIMQPDGSFIVLNEDGTPSDDEAANTVAALLGQEMKKRDQPKNLADNEIWVTDEKSNLTHIQSGGICPKTWGTFSLNKPTIFKYDGSDVSCSYLSQSPSASFTFYFYRNAASAEQATEEMALVFETVAPTGQLTDVTKKVMADSIFYTRHSDHTGSDGVERREGVLIADEDGWQIKLRTTYPVSQSIDLEATAELMLKTQIFEVNETGFQPPLQIQPGDELKTEA